MSRINYQQAYESGLFKGMDTTSPLQALREGFVRSAKNCYPGLAGGLIKRDGHEDVLSSAWGSRKITFGLEYKHTAGSRKTVVFGTDGQGTGGALGYINAGAISSIVSSLDGTVRPSLAQFDSLLFFFNGADAPFVYDNSTTRQVGITAPVAAPTIVLGTGGSLNQSSNYIWAITYYNSVTGAESSPSPLSATTATSTNTKGTLSFSAGDSTTADTIRIWRTYANGQVLYLDGTAAISATSYISTIADSALTATEIEWDNSRITEFSSEAQYPTVAAQRIFLVVDDNEIRFSKFGQSGPMPESFEAKATVDTTGSYGASDKLVGLGKAGDTVIAVKERSVGSLVQIGLPDNRLSSDNVSYIYQELSSEVGGVSHFAGTEVLGEYLFLSRDNVYGTRGQVGDLRQLADPIQATIASLGFGSNQLKRISAFNDTINKLVYFSCFLNSNASEPAYLLVGDYRAYPEFRWTWYTPGVNAGTHPGIRVGCLFSVTSSTTGLPLVYGGNTDSNGQVYQLNSGEDDRGYGIYFEVISRPYDLGNPFAVKLYKDAGIMVQGSGEDYDLQIASIYNLSGEEEENQTFSLTAGGATYDNTDWDEDVYSSNAAPPRSYFIHRKARYQQLVFRQTEADAPVTLFSWGTNGSLFRVA